MPRLPAGDTPPRGQRASLSRVLALPPTPLGPASNQAAARCQRGPLRPAFHHVRLAPGCPQSRLILVRASLSWPREAPGNARAAEGCQRVGTSPGHVWLSRSRGRLLLTAVPRAGRGGAAGALYSQAAEARRRPGGFA